jgi:hypothetical protein
MEENQTFTVFMNEILIYLTIGFLTFFIGLIAGYLATTRYYQGRFLVVAGDCREDDSMVPLIDELERES